MRNAILRNHLKLALLDQPPKCAVYLPLTPISTNLKKKKYIIWFTAARQEI